MATRKSATYSASAPETTKTTAVQEAETASNTAILSSGLGRG